MAQLYAGPESLDVPQERTFYISSGLSFIIVAGQELLHAMDAFRRFAVSGKSEDCATPIFKVRNQRTGPQRPPGRCPFTLPPSLTC